jgi:RNA polymerase sigma factor (TIGR02999 family)
LLFPLAPGINRFLGRPAFWSACTPTALKLPSLPAPMARHSPHDSLRIELFPGSARWYKAGVDITRILEAMRCGDPDASEALLAQVYQELRQLAARKMASEQPGQTLQATALVHEAWLRLGGGNSQHFANRSHFFAAAGEAMRRILVENARRKKRLKRGGDRQRVDFEAIELPAPMPDEELLGLDEALHRLAEADGRAAGLVKLCFFVGLTQEQAAKEMGISISTVERTWAYARAWLFREMEKSRLASK